jgi:hypothetical protein
LAKNRLHLDGYQAYEKIQASLVGCLAQTGPFSRVRSHMQGGGVAGG